MIIPAVSSTFEIGFQGTNIADGDEAKFVYSADAASAASVSCDDDSLSATANSSVANGNATFSLLSSNVTGLLVLCYSFRYAGASSHVQPAPFALFPSIMVAAIRYDGASPNATAVNCSSDITVLGSGFMAFGSATPTSHYCDFEGLSMVPATLVNDSAIRCTRCALCPEHRFTLRHGRAAKLLHPQYTHSVPT
jgi:hypothetical protein